MPLFTFAVVADSHVNPEDGRSSSPWATNRLANARTRQVIRDVNAAEPDFVVHLGDLVHPVPALPTYAPAAERFKALFAPLTRPLYVVPGNHDVGDKPVTWMPAGTVNADHLALYRRHFGRDFYAFDHKGCHFVVLNAQILNSGLASEAEQRTWLEADLEASRAARTFLFLHYPPYIVSPDEDQHYDNLDEPARSWLLGLLARHDVEALFAGHVHNFFYNRHARTDCYVLPSIAFVRHDYSEMFHVGPADEHGRDDRAKLGWMLVEVNEAGHVAHVVRTHGAVEPRPRPVERLPRVHARSAPAPVGMDLRQPWAEVVEIPYTGALDEFRRKKARNDYALLALWEMGLSRLRMPLADLHAPAIRDRVLALAEIGHEFTVFTYGTPVGELRRTLLEHQHRLRAWEVIVRQEELLSQLPGIARLRAEVGVRTFLSKLRTSADAVHDGSRFNHFINHGFVTDETSVLERLAEQHGLRHAVDGIAFRVARQLSPWEEIPKAGRLASQLGLAAAVHVRLADDNPAVEHTDDLATANRVAETLGAAAASPGSDVTLDTLADFDRGYFPRHGLVDRRFDPRLAGKVFRCLQAVLWSARGSLVLGERRVVRGGALCLLDGSADAVALALPDGQLSAAEIARTLGRPMGRSVKILDLAEGLEAEPEGETVLRAPCLVSRLG